MILKVKVQSSAKSNQIIGIESGYLVISIKAQRRKGLANNLLLDFISKSFNIPIYSIKIKSGPLSTQKELVIDRNYAGLLFKQLRLYS